MQADNVLFRSHDGADVCEIKLLDSTVGVFPANEVIAGSVPPVTYAELYREAFDAYKRGHGAGVASGGSHVSELEALVAELTAENAKLRAAVPSAKRKAAPAKVKAPGGAKKKAPAKKAAKAKKK